MKVWRVGPTDSRSTGEAQSDWSFEIILETAAKLQITSQSDDYFSWNIFTILIHQFSPRPEVMQSIPNQVEDFCQECWGLAHPTPQWSESQVEIDERDSQGPIHTTVDEKSWVDESSTPARIFWK